MDRTDVVIIGAGPAGLMCAHILSKAAISAIVVDAGGVHPERNAVEGVGGAGLYSDGKFSFFPAGTALWGLRPSSLLNQAYADVQKVLRQYDVESPNFSDAWISPNLAEYGVQKRYPSVYVGLDARISLISSLAQTANIRAHARATSVTRGKEYVVQVDCDNGARRVAAGTLVIATGRLWGTGLNHDMPTVFRRYEVGVRVEQLASEFVFERHPDLDPKWIYRLDNPRREYRTFCCCRRGTIVNAVTSEGILLSGRADGPPTSRSNFGLMVRYLCPVGDHWTSVNSPFEVPAKALLRSPDTLAQWYGRQASRHLAEALEIIIAGTGGSGLAAATLHGPCLEGVGLYPDVVPERLQLSGEATTWILGDATGLFRGLVPALTSGAYAANAIASRGVSC
jgi:hypothetical protein